MNALVNGWQYAELASHGMDYCVKAPLLQGSIVTPMENNEDSGYIAEFPNKIIFCFQGTKNLRAWVTDFLAYPLKWEGALKNTKTGEPGMIHHAFYEAWSFFKPVIENYLITYSSSSKDTIAKIWKAMKLPPIYVYGHSRGGALAALCARHIAKNLGIPCSCIMYGAPMQGNKQYRNEFNLLPINATDVIHGYEFTRGLPPEWAGFRRVGKFEWLSEPIWHRAFCKIRDHFYSNTTEAFMRYAKNDPIAVRVLEDIYSQSVV